MFLCKELCQIMTDNFTLHIDSSVILIGEVNKTDHCLIIAGIKVSDFKVIV